MANRAFSPLISNQQKKIIHVAKKHCGLDEENYRSLLRQTTGVTTSTKINQHGYKRLMIRFKQLGFTPYYEAAANAAPQPEPSPEKAPLMSKIGALLYELKLPWVYADAMAKQMTGLLSVSWLNPDQLHDLVKALEIHRQRQAAKAVKEEEEISAINEKKEA